MWGVEKDSLPSTTAGAVESCTPQAWRSQWIALSAVSFSTDGEQATKPISDATEADATGLMWV